MEPTSEFWDGVGHSVSTAEGWMVVAAIAVISIVIGVVLIYGKYIAPGRERIKARELDIREREAQNDADRIKANAMLAESQRQTNVLVDGMRQSLDASTARIDVIVSEIHGSRDGSKKMGGTVDRIDQTTQHTDTLVEDIHRHIMGGDGE